MIRAFFPVQFVGVPDKLKTKVSQFTPSTHVLSSKEAPPVAVPTQVRAGPVGLSVPELGVAERKLVVKNANTARKRPITKKSAPIVARPVTEGVEILFIERTLLIFALRFGKMDGGGRLFVLVFFPTALQALECLMG
jgi:hypothetical protein